MSKKYNSYTVTVTDDYMESNDGCMEWQSDSHHDTPQHDWQLPNEA